MDSLSSPIYTPKSRNQNGIIRDSTEKILKLKPLVCNLPPKHKQTNYLDSPKTSNHHTPKQILEINESCRSRSRSNSITNICRETLKEELRSTRVNKIRFQENFKVRLHGVIALVQNRLLASNSPASKSSPNMILQFPKIRVDPLEIFKPSSNFTDF